MAEKRRGLGRGLGALIPSSSPVEDTVQEVSEQDQKRNATSNKPSTPVTVEPQLQVKNSLSKTDDSATIKEESKNATRFSKNTEKQAKKSVSSSQNRGSSTTKKADSLPNKSDVSRETSKPHLSESSRSPKKSSRIDMGAALRNTTVTRRPVDFFFGEDSEENDTQLITVPDAEFAEVNVKDIHPNRKQPRSEFDEQDMDELVHSIKEIGVLQPIVIRSSRESNTEKYELVMGERRWRATQRAGFETIPAIIRDTQDIDLLRDALLENLHRSQLNPIEEAAAYQQLLEEFGTTQDELAQRIGRSRPQISNMLRLLKLPALVQRRVAAGVLSSGHARALLGLRSQAEIEKISQKIVNEGLSVRAVEELVHASAEETSKERKAPQPQKHHERLDYIAEAFADKLDTDVRIQLGTRKGKMTIEFASVEDLNRIISVLDPRITK